MTTLLITADVPSITVVEQATPVSISIVQSLVSVTDEQNVTFETTLPSVTVQEQVADVQVRIDTTQVVLLDVGAIGPQGPPGTPGSGSTPISMWTNNDASTQTIGQVVYLSGAAGVRLAKADDPSRANAVALCASASVPSLTVGAYQTAGVLSGLVGLITDAVYYLSDLVAGLLTTTPPVTLGHLVVEIGVAVSPTDFLIRPRRAFVL